MWLDTCFRVLVFPVRSLMYLAINSLRPYIFPSSERMIFRRPHGGYMASASWKLCSMSGLQTPSASELETSLAPRPPPDEGPSLELESSEPASESGACGGGAPPPPPVRPGPEFQGDEILNTDMGATLQVYRETVEVAVSAVQTSTRQPRSSGQRH